MRVYNQKFTKQVRSYVNSYELFCNVTAINKRFYGRWIRRMVIDNPVMKEGVDYFRSHIKMGFGRGYKNTFLLTKPTAIAICVSTRTIVAKNVRLYIEETF